MKKLSLTLAAGVTAVMMSCNYAVASGPSFNSAWEPGQSTNNSGNFYQDNCQYYGGCGNTGTPSTNNNSNVIMNSNNIQPVSTVNNNTFTPRIVNTTNQSVTGTVTDHYKNVIVKSPYQTEVCTQGGGNSNSQILGQNFDLGGAIIGGIIGNNVTKDLPDGGTAGAIIGGLIGGQNNAIGNQGGVTCRVVTQYQNETREVYSHSTMTFTDDNGKQYTVRFRKQ